MVCIPVVVALHLLHSTPPTVLHPHSACTTDRPDPLPHPTMPHTVVSFAWAVFIHVNIVWCWAWVAGPTCLAGVSWSAIQSAVRDCASLSVLTSPPPLSKLACLTTTRRRSCASGQRPAPQRRRVEVRHLSPKTLLPP
jgi:hypothetical protein